MIIAILANAEQRAELLSRPTSPGTELIWADSLRSLMIIDADAYFDLLFEDEPERIARLKQLLPRPVIVRSTAGARPPFIRINAGPGMLARPLLELATGPSQEAPIRELLGTVGWEYTIVPAVLGTALILSIDTALEQGGVCISRNADLISYRTNDRQSDHARWAHLAIGEVLAEAGIAPQQLDAVAVTAGPGSYTGIRVGMAAAKGLCYALQVPLVTESTLYLTAIHARKEAGCDAWICPMIDARRMEVFTALYDHELRQQMEPGAMILGEHSFQPFLEAHPIVFAGNGCLKWQQVCKHDHALFSPSFYTLPELAGQMYMKYSAGQFTDLAYSEPYYLKNVYTGTKDA